MDVRRRNTSITASSPPISILTDSGKVSATNPGGERLGGKRSSFRKKEISDLLSMALLKRNNQTGEGSDHEWIVPFCFF